MLIVLLIPIVSIVLIYCYVHICYNYWKVRNVPFVTPKLIIGNILNIFMGKYSPAKYISQLCNEIDGPYVGFYIIHTPFLIVKDQKLIKRILVTDFEKFPNKIFINDKVIDPTFSNSLLSLENVQWKNVRIKISRIFSPAKIKAMISCTKHCAESLRMYVDTKLNRKVDLKDLTTRFSTEVVSLCVFGIESKCFLEKQSVVNHYAHKIFPKAFVGLFKGFSYVFLPQLVRVFKYEFFDPVASGFFRTIFSETIKHRENVNVKRNDLIDILIDIKNKNSSKLAENTLLAQAVAFLAVGHEAISTIVALTMYELCINKDIQVRLRDEIINIIDTHGDITYDALDEMKYLDMVVCESLRKYPVIPFIQRKCVEDHVLPETGLKLEKGTPIIIPTHWLHYDPTFFPDPYAYDPERFNDKKKEIIKSYVYLPFSAGPRSCLGRRFALMNVKICIIYLLKHFEVERDFATKDELVFGSSHALDPKEGIPVRFRQFQL